jgi:hypothetical protein
MEMVGRMFTVNVISDKSVQLVVKKIIRKKPVLISFSVYGYVKSNFDKLKLLKNEKIKITFSIAANLYKSRYYNDLNCEKVERVAEAPKYGNETVKDTGNPDLFNSKDSFIEGIENFIIDEETGEVLL